MSGRRVLALYALLVGCFAAVVCRLYWLCSHADYAARAAAQSVVIMMGSFRSGGTRATGSAPLRFSAVPHPSISMIPS